MVLEEKKNLKESLWERRLGIGRKREPETLVEEVVSLKAEEEEDNNLNNGNLSNSGNPNRDNEALMKLMKYARSVSKESILHQTTGISMIKNIFQEFQTKGK